MQNEERCLHGERPFLILHFAFCILNSCNGTPTMAVTYAPGLRVSEYVLEERVGAGTFGEVWRARHHIWDTEQVAVKLPTEPEYVRFLQREGRVVHGLRHPNIVRVFGLDPYAETPYLVMELVRGPALRAVLAEHKKGLPLDAAVVILRGLLRAMAVAHAAGVIHRDLKPGNVLLNLAGRGLDALAVDDVKVGDFGLGVGSPDALKSMIEQSASLARDEQGATLAGTLAYMAPEIRDGAHAPDARGDLYAIGVILFEMLTGERPAGAEVPSTLRPDCPPGLDGIFRRLYTRYENRYETADAVLADLEAAIQAPRLPPVPPPLPPGAREPRGSVCAHCQARVEPLDQFCTQCGTQLAPVVRRCASCGAYPGLEDNYCIYCGTEVATT
jgi:serine/threonine protein kinase